MHTLNAPNNIAKVTNQWGAIPISLLNSHFHSSIGTSHSKTCITLPPLPDAAQHDNQVKTLSPYFLSHTASQDQSQISRFTRTHELIKHLSMSQTSGNEGLSEFIVTNIHFTSLEENTNVTSSRHIKSKYTQGNTHIHKHRASTLLDANIHYRVTPFDLCH